MAANRPIRICFYGGEPLTKFALIQHAVNRGREEWGDKVSFSVSTNGTLLNEDSISQGQKQLLCITRVMLTLPPMLILDEATSNIDTRTELQVQDAFDKLMRGKTSFVVAHRLSTVRNASLILVMKDGKIIEQGTHDELLARGGFYNKLYNSQFQPV